MKIAVITAIFGGMEDPKPFVEQSVECARIVITPDNTPVPLPNLPPRLRAKYFKLQAHKVWPQYQCFVWIDGNVEVTNPDFVKAITHRLRGEIAIQRHHERQTLEQEIDLITSSGNPYLTVRYGAQPLRAEYEHYMSVGIAPTAPLFACNIFAYHVAPQTKAFFDDWWRLVLEWTWFDQSAFSALAYKFPLVRLVAFGPMFDNPYFKLHPHKNWQQ